MKNETIVEIKNLFFSYANVPVLEDINLSIKQRDFLGIIGPNGGGKTTILKIILGLLSPDGGSVEVFGLPPSKGRKHIGYIPQAFNFDFSFPINVLDVVLMGRLRKRGVLKRYTKEDVDIARGALNKVGMNDFWNTQIGSLSEGQRQRVLIARALSTGPKLLLLDEPASSIDSRWQGSFFTLLKQLTGEMAVILVSHDIGALSVHVEQVACLNRRLYYHGTTKEGIKHLSDTYECPVELIAHGIPHRVLGDHE